MTGPDRMWQETRRLLPDADLVLLPARPGDTWIGRAALRPGDASPADAAAARTRPRAGTRSVLVGLTLLWAGAACTDGAGTPPATGPAPTASGATPEQVRAGTVQRAREAVRDLTGLRFAVDGAGRYTQCTDDGEYILFDVTIRLRQTPASAPAPRTPAITTALTRRGWELDPTRGNSGATGTSTVLLRAGGVLRIEEYADDPGLLLMELTSDCVDAGDRNPAYVGRGSERLRLG